MRISEQVKIANPSNVSIGDYCFIGLGVQLYAWEETISIGSNVLIAPDVWMITRKNGFSDLDIPVSDQGYIDESIVIEDNVWIGFRALILPGVTIKTGGIVGASAVVTKDVSANSIVGGVPARLICMRNQTIND